MHSHRITDVADIKRFVLGGNARFTLVSKKTGTRFTYRARKPEPGDLTFVSLMNGPDNESSYEFLGTIFPDGSYRHGKRSRIAESAASATAFAWFHAIVAAGRIPDTLEFWHEGRCGRCGRTLTVPESIATGFGPECASILRVVPERERTTLTGEGLARAERRHDELEAEFALEIQRREADEERVRMNRKFGLPLDYKPEGWPT